MSRDKISYAARRFTVGRADQHRKLDLCGLPRETFGDAVDPAFLAALAPLEPSLNGVTLNGFVATGQSLQLMGPVLLDHDLELSGEANRNEEEEGITLVSSLRLAGAGGATVAKAEATLFRRNPAAPRSPGRGGFVPDTAALVTLGQARFTPEAVAAYAGRDVNPIHVDPAAAEAAGFRAPIAAGTHGLHYLTNAACRRLRSGRTLVQVSFHRPVFWDDVCDIMGSPPDAPDMAFGLVREGKPLLWMRLGPASETA